MVDRLLDGILNSEENRIKDEDVILSPFLPVIDKIHNAGIRSFVRAVLLHAPPWFWTTSSGLDNTNYPPDELEPGGLVLHTIRVARIAYDISIAQDRTQREIDMLLAAALLHDLTKAVEEVDGSIGYDPMHAYTVEGYINWVREEDERTATDVSSSTLFIDEDDLQVILRMIRCHKGVWSPIPETYPLTPLEWALHFSDMLAQKLHHIIDGKEIQAWRWKEATEDEASKG